MASRAISGFPAGVVLIHLLNYTAHPVHNVKVTVKGAMDQVRLLSPDGPRDPARVMPPSAGVTEIEVPELGTYSLLVLTSR
jgi:hypothetical protein